MKLVKPQSTPPALKLWSASAILHNDNISENKVSQVVNIEKGSLSKLLGLHQPWQKKVETAQALTLGERLLWTEMVDDSELETCTPHPT